MSESHAGQNYFLSRNGQGLEILSRKSTIPLALLRETSRTRTTPFYALHAGRFGPP